MQYKNSVLWRKLVRYLFFFLGLICFGLGVALCIKMKHLGLYPWDVLNVALFHNFGLSIGTWSVIIGLILILISLMINRKYVNIGIFMNALLIGPIMDFFLWLDFLLQPNFIWTDYLWVFLGILIVGIGGGLYGLAGIGAGSRDGFMLFISDKTGFSVSKARIFVECVVLVIGYFLGDPVFFVTFFYTFILSPVFQFSLKVFVQVQNQIDKSILGRCDNSI